MEKVKNGRASVRELKLALDRFGQTSMAASAALLGISLDDFLGLACLCCITAASSGRRSWPVPRFGTLVARDSGIEVSVALAEDDWEALEAEADRQHVALERLLHHAALCLMADLDRATTVLR